MLRESIVHSSNEKSDRFLYLAAKKLSVMKIRKICVSGKALREEVVPERGSGELAGTSKVYLDSCNSEFESIKCCSSLSTSVIKSCKKVCEKFVDLFSEKIKSSRDKYAVLRARWYEYVREVLKSWEARKLVHDSWKDGDIARSMVVGQRKMLGSMFGSSLRSRSQQSN